MRKVLRAFIALACLGSPLTAPGRPEAAADPARHTVSDLFRDWTERAAAIETSAEAAQRRSDAALAQRLSVLAAMTNRVAGELRSAEQYSLDLEIARLPAPIPERIKAAESGLAAASAMTDASGRADLAAARAGFNALLAAVTTARSYPVLYGMLTRDLSLEPAAEPADVMIYGFNLVDPKLGKKPEVSVERVDLPDSSVSVQDDVVLITLPPEVKAAIGFAPSACGDRKTFGLRTHSFYLLQHGFWPLIWRSEQASVADFNALATPVVYAAKVGYAVDSVRTSVAEQSFSKKSGFVSADCARTASTAMTIDLPAGASDMTCTARWVDTTSAATADAHCQVRSGAIVAEGAIGGFAKVCSGNQLCSCPSSAHGWLETTGTYRLSVEAPAIEERTLKDALSFGVDSSASASVPLAPGETLRGLSLAISRRDCDAVADALDLPTPGGLAPNLAAASRTGAFRALYRAGRLVVGGAGADAFNAVADP